MNKLINILLCIFILLLNIRYSEQLLSKDVKYWENRLSSLPVPNTGNEENMSSIYRNSEHLYELVENFDSSMQSLYSLYIHGLLLSNDSFLYGRRILGDRSPDIIGINANRDKSYDHKYYKYKKRNLKKGAHDNEIPPGFEWFKYSSIIALSQYFGSGLLSLENSIPYIDLSPDIKNPVRSIILLSSNRLEWGITDLTCSMYGIVIAPLYDVLGEEGIVYSINLVKSNTVVVSYEALNNILKVLGKLPNINYVIVMKPNNLAVVGSNMNNILRQDDKLLLYGNKIDINEYNVPVYVNFLTFEKVIELGKSNLKLTEPTKYNDINSIYFTSGTTGLPKGAIQTNGNWISGVAGPLKSFLSHSDVNLTKDDVYLSYLPLAHIFERIVSLILIYSGAKIAFYNGDILNLGKDLHVLRPTLFVTVPRLFLRLQKNRLLPQVLNKGKLKQKFFFYMLKRKINSKNPVKDFFSDLLVFNKISKLIGGKIKYTLSGAAPLESGLQQNMRALLKTNLVQGYGTTEALAAFCPEFRDLTTSNIGGPIPSVEFRLLSVPEMDYDSKGTPPRGELLLRGPTVFKGYLKQYEETAATIDSDGWLHTGDIVELLQNGNLKIIDRKKFLFKLSQGEYISPELQENMYISNSPFISQMFIHGKSEESVLMAIVVLDQLYIQIWAKKANILDTNLDWDYQFMKLCNEANDQYIENRLNTLLRTSVIESISDTEKKNKVVGFKRINDFLFECTPFSIENDLLTPTSKLMRFKARKIYTPKIDMLYDRYHEKNDR